jgi:hypothetical protein
MKIVMVAAAAAALGLAACTAGSVEENMVSEDGNQANVGAEANTSEGGKEPAGADANAQAAAPGANEAKEGGPSATASSPAAEIRALLIGRWTDGGNCAGGTEFRDDGTFTSADAGAGRWEQSNEYLTLTGDRATVELAVQEIDRTDMVTINPQGRIGRWTRC